MYMSHIVLITVTLYMSHIVLITVTLYMSHIVLITVTLYMSHIVLITVTLYMSHIVLITVTLYMSHIVLITVTLYMSHIVLITVTLVSLRRKTLHKTAQYNRNTRTCPRTTAGPPSRSPVHDASDVTSGKNTSVEISLGGVRRRSATRRQVVLCGTRMKT